jgi:DNA mismatch repair protein MutL
LIILDQHGAHERILYEKLSKNIRGAPADLAFPMVVRLPDDLAPEV